VRQSRGAALPLLPEGFVGAGLGGGAFDPFPGRRDADFRCRPLRFAPGGGRAMLCAMRILVVEDDSKIASFVVNGLKQNGFAVDQAADGERGLALAGAVNYDAVVLDLMLPKLDGLSLVGQLRARGARVPVLMLSARASVDDRVKGLQAGGDDYLTKPFAFSELLARLQALIRRASHTTEPTRLSAGPLTLDLMTREVTRHGAKIELQPKEFALLEFFLRHAGRVVTKTMILEHIYDFSFDPQTNVVDVLVHRLRAKVDPDKNLIQTQRGVGYVFKPA
jgi:two-component system OmpR family response regulator